MKNTYLRLLRVVFAVFLVLAAFSGLASSARADRILAGPYLQAPGSDGITIRWIGDVAEGGVEYERGGKSALVESTGVVSTELSAFLFEAKLSGLEPDASYMYRVRVGDALSSSFRFRTSPPAGAGFTFLAISDAQLKPDVPATIAAVSLVVRPDLIIFSGDLVDTPEIASNWFGAERAFFDVLTGRRGGAALVQYAPLFPTLGNHETSKAIDVHTPAAEATEVYSSLFTLPGNERYYSHDYGNTHFVHLNVSRRWSNNPVTKAQWPLGDSISPGSAQFQWLVADLKANRQPWTVVSLHHPPLGRGHNTTPGFCEPVENDDGTFSYPRDMLYDDLRPLFEANGVDLVLYGHSHLYEHYSVNGIHYVEASSIGNSFGFKGPEPHGLKAAYQNDAERSFAIVEVGADTMQVSAYNAQNGKKLESFEIHRRESEFRAVGH